MLRKFCGLTGITYEFITVMNNKKTPANSAGAFLFKNKNYFARSSLNFLPAEKAGTVFAAIFKVAPV